VQPTETRVFQFRGQDFQAVVNPQDHSSWWTFTDEQVVRDTLFQVQPGDMLFDIGCGYGSYAFSALAIGVTHAHCWTINPPHLDLMKLSVAANGWTDKVTLNGTGLYKEPGWLVESTQAFTQAAVPGQECFQVDTLDAYVARLSSTLLPTPGKVWLKIDTEGAELNILQGAKQFILDYRPTIILENHESLVPGITQACQDWLHVPLNHGGPGYQVSKWVPYHKVSHSVYLPEECCPS
jgi:FkbM family methyltransferase